MKNSTGSTPVSQTSKLLLKAVRFRRVPILGPLIFALALADARRYGRLDAARNWPPAKSSL